MITAGKCLWGLFMGGLDGCARPVQDIQGISEFKKLFFGVISGDFVLFPSPTSETGRERVWVNDSCLHPLCFYHCYCRYYCCWWWSFFFDIPNVTDANDVLWHVRKSRATIIEQFSEIKDWLHSQNLPFFLPLPLPHQTHAVCQNVFDSDCAWCIKKKGIIATQP